MVDFGRYFLLQHISLFSGLPCAGVHPGGDHLPNGRLHRAVQAQRHQIHRAHSRQHHWSNGTLTCGMSEGHVLQFTIVQIAHFHSLYPLDQSHGNHDHGQVVRETGF